MLFGHYSAAFLAKAAEPRLPLWSLAIAVQFVDVSWAACLLLGIEHMRIDPALASNPFDLYDMPYTHSLVGVLGWAALAAAAAFAWQRSGVAALVVGAAVASHWLADWLVHRPDLLLWSGSAKHGLALWNFPLIALALELTLLVASAGLWLRTRRVSGGERRRALRFVAVLAAAQIGFTLIPPPFGPMGIACIALALFAAVAWGAWRVERGVPPT
jgi:membrane-bound metal-dependent hydrolase YbcI (DUF457 family)